MIILSKQQRKLRVQISNNGYNDSVKILVCLLHGSEMQHCKSIQMIALVKTIAERNRQRERERKRERLPEKEEEGKL
jgi:hypothetical protein